MFGIGKKCIECGKRTNILTKKRCSTCYQRERRRNPEIRKKINKRIQERYKTDPEFREKRRAAIKKCHSRPESKERRNKWQRKFQRENKLKYAIYQARFGLRQLNNEQITELLKEVGYVRSNKNYIGNERDG